MKRKIAIKKASGDFKGAITLLNEYLTVFMADAEGWAELADLYTALQMSLIQSIFLLCSDFFLGMKRLAFAMKSFSSLPRKTFITLLDTPIFFIVLAKLLTHSTTTPFQLN